MLVVVAERLASIRRDLSREAAPAQHSGERIEPRHLKRQVTARRVYQNLIPVDTHVGGNAHLATRTEELAREIYRHGLRPADGNTDVFDHSAPTSARILHLQRGQHHALAAL